MLRRALASLAAVVVTALTLSAAPPAAAEGGYSPPVDAPVVDGWRPPPTLFAAGNRGIDLGAAEGDPVRSAAGGEVVFAGTVALDHHVVVLHDDGIRTSYSFLQSVGVARGDRVERGDEVGVAAGPVHFGARAGDRYIDPMLLLDGGRVDVRLVPVELRSPQSVAAERRGLVDGLVGAGRWMWRAGSSAVSWARAGAAEVDGRLRAEIERWLVMVEALGSYADLVLDAGHQLRRGLEYRRDQEGCTPGDVAVPPRRGGRRIAVLVGGFGSTSDDAAIDDVDTAGLGYGEGDVARFSYAGGQVPGERRLARLPVNGYGVADSQQSIAASAERFRAFLHDVRREHPGVPVDVIAHSQGGVVVLQALDAADRLDPRMPRVGNVITLGSPHDGADIATAGALLSRTLLGSGVRRLGAGTPAADDLSETSAFMQSYIRRPPPHGVRVTSIAAAGDAVVPATHSVLPGEATHALVPLVGPHAHEQLPGSDLARREMALALVGMGPTCRDTVGAVVGAVAISAAEDAVGDLLGVPALRLENPVSVIRSPAQAAGR